MINSRPLISIILPAYNVEKKIEGTINSLCKQSYSNIELICVDDGSSDGTYNALRLFMQKDDRIKVFSKNNGGVSSARNYGLDRAQGEFIVFTDPGDIVSTDYIEYLYNLISLSNYQMAVCSYDFVKNDGKILDRSKIYEPVSEPIVFNRSEAIAEIIKIYGKFCGHVWDKIFKTDFIGDSLRFDKKLHNGEDTLFVFEYLNRCNKVILGPKVCYRYILDGNSVTRSKYSEKYYTSLNAWIQIFEEEENPNLKYLIKQRVNSEILSHEVKAWKTLSNEERKKYKIRFLNIMDRFKCFPNITTFMKWIFCKLLWTNV